MANTARASLIIMLLALASCAHHARSVTQMDATYLSATPHVMLVRLESPGAFSNSRSLPLGGNVKVTINGKPASLEKIREGQRIRISRDTRTHEVVAIDVL